MRKKKIVINTDFPLLKSGLGRNGKELALYLYKTGKYDIIYYACGSPWENPDYARFPFKVVGTLPNNPIEMEQIQRDPTQARDAAYGAYNIDRVIKEFKPDVLITSNDSWGSQPYLSRLWWNKIHCIPHITLDSLPFMPDQKKYIESSKKFYVWADFAKKEAERLGYKNVEVLTGIINPKHFYKLSRQEKLKYRKKFNIPENAFITGFVFRNQIRKEAPVLIEGYSLFKKQNPEIKNTYLLLHTSFSEGWNIPLLCDEYGVDKKEILTTYICRNCREIEVKPFVGQDLNCSHCGAPGSPQGTGQITCNVQFGCTEEELNVVYNLMDVYIHLANAAGLEMPCCEALYAELPLATMAYASCEMFTDQPFVTSVDFAWGTQHGTQFKRAVPYASSVAKAMKKFALMPLNEREKLGKQGREWALSMFSPEVVCKQWEKIIDELPEIAWNYDFSVPLKDPNATIENISDNKEWVRQLYNKILKVEPDENGWNYWMNLLNQGVSRDQIRSQFSSIAHQDNLKNGQKQETTLEDLLDKNNKKRLLITMPQSIGDVFIVTATFENIRERYPKSEWDIYFATDPNHFSIVEGCPHIDKLIPYHPSMDNLLAMEGYGDQRGLFDVAYLAHAPSQRLLVYVHNGIDIHGLELTKS